MPSEEMIKTDIARDGVFFVFDRPSHAAICLAQGLEELSIPRFASPSADLAGATEGLFALQGGRVDQAGITVLDLSRNEHLGVIEPKFDVAPKRLVALSIHDNNAAAALPAFVPFFVSHANDFYRLPGTRVPWAFGPSRRILASAAEGEPATREPVFLRNFRPSTNQTVRASLDLAFVPRLARYFAVDRTLDDAGHFSDRHFARLRRYLGCLAYGGSIVENLNRPGSAQENIQHLGHFFADPVVLRWDSWRFWESIACGAVTVQLDMQRYGFRLPVMPTNWVHYVGIGFDTLADDVERLNDERRRLSEIGAAGRSWVLAHYAPEVVARRFIDTAASHLADGAR